MNAKILVYISSAREVPRREGGSNPAGIALGELIESLKPLIQAGYTLSYTSPDGKAPTIDKNSLHLVYWNFSKKRRNNALFLYEKLKQSGLTHPQKIETLVYTNKALGQYDGLFIPGGHAPMTDIVFRNWLKDNRLNEHTGKLLSYFHQHKKPTALICHGTTALVTAPQINNTWIYKGYTMTCVSAVSEWLTENMPPIKTMSGHMPDYPEKMLKKKGAILKQMYIPMISNVVEDRELITGQDPYSAQELGKRFKIKVEKYLTRITK